MEPFCPVIVFFVYRHDHIREPCHPSLDRIVDHPVQLWRSFIEVKPVYHVYDFCPCSAGFSRRKSCHNAHNRFVCPDDIPAFSRDHLFHIFIAFEILRIQRTAVQPYHMNLRIFLQRTPHLVNAVPHHRTGKIDLPSILRQIPHMRHQELYHHQIR